MATKYVRSFFSHMLLTASKTLCEKDMLPYSVMAVLLFGRRRQRGGLLDSISVCERKGQCISRVQ